VDTVDLFRLGHFGGNCQGCTGSWDGGDGGDGEKRSGTGTGGGVCSVMEGVVFMVYTKCRDAVRR